MGKVKRKIQRQPHVSKPVVEYKDDKHVPDFKRDDYFYDAVDEFHLTRDKIPLDDRESSEEDQFQNTTEDVLPIVDSSDEDDDEELEEYEAQLKKMRSKLIIKNSESDTDSSVNDEVENDDDKAWGTQRKTFYGADIDDNDIDLSDNENDEKATAKLEEEEALLMQRKIAEEFDEDDFGFNFITQKKEKIAKDELTVIPKNINDMSEFEKKRMLYEKAPELNSLVSEYEKYMAEMENSLAPIVELLKEKDITEDNDFNNYIQYKTDAVVGYCVNISFYLALNVKEQSVNNHPVIDRIMNYRKIVKNLKSLDTQFLPKIHVILQNIAERDTILNSVLFKKKSKKRKVPEQEIQYDDEEDYTEENNEANGGSAKLRKMKLKDDLRKADEQRELGVDEKRAITYQIAKNKGLTPHRKKLNRNPRVKHKEKFRKAKIRRKGMIKEPRTELQKYGGEHAGIRAAVKRSVKFK